MTGILIAAHEPRISSFVRKGLSANGFTARVVADGQTAYRHARRGDIDLMVLDAKLPVMDGFEVLRRLRSAGSTLPVVMMIARTGLADSVARIAGDADDYVVKPFRFEQLLSIVRRRLATPKSRERNVLSHDGLRLDLRTCRAYVGDYWVDLSSRECALAEIFLRHPGQTLTRERLRRHVWGDEAAQSSNVVDVYVSYLRRKLGAGRITARRGVGYRLELMH